MLPRIQFGAFSISQSSPAAAMFLLLSSAEASFELHIVKSENLVIHFLSQQIESSNHDDTLTITS